MSKLHFLRRSRFFVLFVSMAVLLVPLTLPIRNAAMSGGITSSSPKAAPALARQQERPSKIYCPYWYLDKDTKAVLEITNNDAVSKAVTPTLLVGGSERVSLESVTIPSHATRRISLNKALKSRVNSDNGASGDRRWGDGSRRGGVWGSATLEGESLYSISSKVLSENPKESLAVHSGFYEYGGNSVSSMWWLPTKKSVALMALQNASYHESSVATLLYLDGRVVSGPRFKIPGNGSRLVDLRELAPKSITKKLPQVGMVRFVADSQSAALLGRAILFDEQQGFSVPLAMRGLLAHTGNTLQLVGAPFGRLDKRMGFPKGTKFTTQLLLTNTSNTSIDATVTLDGRSDAGEPVSWDLPVVQIAPLQSVAVDLDKVRTGSHSPIVNGHAGVRLTHTGSGLDLFAEAITVDRTLKFSFDNAFYDNESVGTVYNAISFNLIGNKNTLLLIKNPSNATLRFGYRLNYEKQDVMQSYKSKLLELKPYELRVVDLRVLRDSRVPDDNGVILPADVEFGNANIYSNKPIISGDPNFDSVAGISSSCISPCGAGFEGPERCPFSSCPGCEPCEYHPELCEEGGQQCANGCAACLIQRSTQTAACQLVFAAAEGAAFAAYLAQINACENNGFCREDEPTFDPEECDRCKGTALTIYLVAAGAAAGVFALCMNLRRDCSTETRTVPFFPFCVPCIQ